MGPLGASQEGSNFLRREGSRGASPERWPGFAADDGDVFGTADWPGGGDMGRPVLDNAEPAAPSAPRTARGLRAVAAPSPGSGPVIRSRELRFRWMILSIKSYWPVERDDGGTTPSAGAGAWPVGFQSTRRLRTGHVPLERADIVVSDVPRGTMAPYTERTSPRSISNRRPGAPNSASSDSVACNVVTTS